MAAAPEAGIWRRMLRAFRHVFRSEIGGTFRLLLAIMLGLLLGINALNVVNSYVGRDLMTAVEQHDMQSFASNALAWLGVFAGLTVAAVILRFCEERLALLWRDWLTRSLVGRYLEGGAYLRMKERGDLGNPDQRITDDVRAFTATTISFTLMLVNATLVVIAFSGVLWSISPTLFVLAVVYAALGSALTVALGRPLVRLNYDQSDREASFRAELVHAGENAESVALLKLEGRLETRLSSRLDALVLNMKRIVAVNRSVGFFATGYGYGIQLLPPLIVGPLFMKGKVDFGVVTQSAMAFAQLLGAFSLIVNQFGSISSYAASLARLGSFSSALDAPRPSTDGVAERAGGRERLVFDDLTLLSRVGDECLVSHLGLSVDAGTRLLVTGTEEARRALFRATALGPSASGSGRVLMPGPERVLFLPERPYVPPSTLRELIVRSGQERAVSDHDIATVLKELELETALSRVGGLDVERDFSHVLSLGEQQLLAVARVILAAPAFVVLHNPGTTLAPEQLELALARLGEAGVTYLTLGGLDAPLDAYDGVLELHAGGAWGFRRDSKLPSRPRSQPFYSR
ncbi:MAG TPA: SbmA/BacA-like family transporter [Polyangiaceae bacterium]|nr:SbmA/BacA-like family transporter [Polyangiaceae bacterium]